MSKWSNRKAPPPKDYKKRAPKTLLEAYDVELHYHNFDNPLWKAIRNLKPGQGLILRGGNIYKINHKTKRSM